MRRFPPSLVSLFVTSVLPFSAPFARAAPVIDDPNSFVIGFMSSLTTSCMREVHARAPVPAAACACVAALAASRFTKDELIASGGKTGAMAKIHPELVRDMATCATMSELVRQ